MSAQTLKVYKSPVEKYSEDAVLFAPIIEPETGNGVFFSQQKANQFLNIFNINTKKFLVKTISTARKKKSNVNTFITEDADEVVFSASFYYKKKGKKGKTLLVDLDANGSSAMNNGEGITYLSYVFVNNYGSTQIQTLKYSYVENKWKENYKSAEFKYVNYPVLLKKQKYLCVAATDNGIVYNFSNELFRNMQIIKENTKNHIYTAPVISPKGEYLAYLDMDLTANKSSIIVNKLVLKADKIKLKKIIRIDHGRNIHCQSPSFSPDETKIAFFSNKGHGNDIYSIYYRDLPSGGRDHLIAQKALKNSMLNHGPAWLNNNLIVYVKYSSRDKFPIYYRDIRKNQGEKLNIPTLMNKDVIAWRKGDSYHLLYASIGKKGDRDLTKNKIYLVELKIQ